jgi:glycosyltransferase involved in cell wall biosynthesis
MPVSRAGGPKGSCPSSATGPKPPLLCENAQTASQPVLGGLPLLPPQTLLLAGSGPDRQKLEELAARLGIKDRVRFLGSVDQNALCEIYNCADISILASSREGWANVLLESMACGTPVLGTAVWGTPEVIASPDAGLLLKNRDAESIVSGIGQ